MRAAGNAILAAGADKFVWMLYYNINLGNFAWTYVRRNAPDWVAAFMPPAANPNLQPLIDPM
jgi:hypothetical protein